MASGNLPSSQQSSLYPSIDQSNPNSSSPFISNPNPNPNPKSAPSSSSPLYPSIDTSNLDNLLPHDYRNPNPNPRQEASSASASAPPIPMSMAEPVEETIITVPGAIIHLIDNHYSVALGIGDFSVIRIRQADNFAAVLARLSDEVQWPLMKDVAVVKVDDSHYFFSFPNVGGDDGNDLLSYGLSFASKGQDNLLKELDRVFAMYGNFSMQGVSEKSKGGVPGIEVAGEMSPEELKFDKGKREIMARNCGAYWTTLAPNVEEYSGTAAKYIAAGSGQLIKGILWCGDVAVDRLNWGQEVLKKRLEPSQNMEIDENTLKRIQRVKKMTIMTKKAAGGLLTGVLKISGFFTSSVANSKMGKKFFSLLPGEVVLASLDGLNRICDAAEVAGKNVLSTTSSVTTELATHKYGEEAGKATNEGLGAAGHAIGTAWTVFKLRKALNPKSFVRSTSLAKSAARTAAEEYKSKKSTSLKKVQNE